jgi:transposase
VVWTRRGKNAATLRAFFENLGHERCQLIESTTIDMSGAFISAVKEMVPNARMMFDHFHVQRLVQDTLDNTRRDEVRASQGKESKKALKESFAAILDRRLIHVARKMLIAWIVDARASGLVHFAKTAGTIERHLDGILEYVRTRFSNGRVEGMNGKIRTITRRSFGFHSATALISMIFLCCGGVHVTPAFSRPSHSH